MFFGDGRIGVTLASTWCVLDRRSFLGVLGSLAYTTLTRSIRAPRTLRVATVVDAGALDLERGLSFGATEADRSAALFGWHVERVAIANDFSNGSPEAHALIFATGGRLPRDDIPVLRLVCAAAPENDDSFLLAPCDASVGDVWQPTLERFGAQQLNDRYRSAMGSTMTGDAWLGWFAFKVLMESALRVNTTNARALTDYLSRPDTSFDGHKGVALRFDSGRRLVQPFYRRGG